MRGFLTLLINLYKDCNINSSINRITRQIETRQFNLKSHIDLEKANLTKDEIIPFIAYYNEMCRQKRQYNVIAGGRCDNMFLFEACGLERGSTENTLIVDFSESLDYVLHRLSGCSVQAVRNIPDYSNISKAVMNLQFSKLQGVTMGVFLESDTLLKEYITNLLAEASKKEDNDSEALQQMLYLFFSNVMYEVSRLKDYCMQYLIKHLDSKVIYRSKSFAASAASCSSRINMELVLRSDGYDDYVLPLHSYKTLEYLKGGVL
jgi:hypothetical protein